MQNVVYLKNWPFVKGLCGMCFICLRPPPLLWPHTPPPPPIHTAYVCTRTVYLFTQGGGGGERKELTREKVRGAIVHKAGRKYQHGWQYLQSIHSIKHNWNIQYRCLLALLLIGRYSHASPSVHVTWLLPASGLTSGNAFLKIERIKPLKVLSSENGSGQNLAHSISFGQ